MCEVTQQQKLKISKSEVKMVIFWHNTHFATYGTVIILGAALNTGSISLF